MRREGKREIERGDTERYGTGIKTIRQRETALCAASKKGGSGGKSGTPDATALRHRRTPLVPLLPFRVDVPRAFPALASWLKERTKICR